MLNKIVLLICVFFSVVSKANLLDSRNPLNANCRHSFILPVPPHRPSIPTTNVPTLKTEAPSNETTLLVANIPTLKTEATKEYWFTHLKETSSNFINLNQELPSTWKKDLLESLPILDTPQILNLLDHIKELKNKGILFEQSFFQSLIEKITPIIPKFNRTELINILYDFASMELTVTDSLFIQAWRSRALKLRRSFISQDRYYLVFLFRQLEIPPLRNPHDLNSGYVEVPIEATRNIQP